MPSLPKFDAEFSFISVTSLVDKEVVDEVLNVPSNGILRQNASLGLVLVFIFEQLILAAVGRGQNGSKRLLRIFPRVFMERWRFPPAQVVLRTSTCA